MPKTLRRLSPRALVSRLLDAPNFAALVQELPAPALGRIVQHIGLEDSAEILQCATSEQLSELLDTDVWHSFKPGEDETFDAQRFTLWLEVMLECGEDWLADKLVEMSEDLVTLAFQRQMFVLDTDELALLLRQGEEALEEVEKALDDCLCEELDQYLVVARKPEGWDVLLTALLAADKNHHHWVERLLERCCAISSDYIEDNGGLYDVLTAEELLEGDVSGAREERRAAQGFIAPSRAAHFLELARTTPLSALADADHQDPISRAYFRELAPKQAPRGSRAPAGRAQEGSGRVLALLQAAAEEQAGDAEAAAAAVSAPPAGANAGERLPAFQAAMATLRGESAELHARRLEELAFVSNVLMVGALRGEGSLRSFEAAEAAVAGCQLGLAYLLGGAGNPAEPLALERLRRHSAVQLFALGWHLCQNGVVLGAEVLASHAELAVLKRLSGARRPSYSEPTGPSA
jgi:hypothetical protein